MKNKNFILPEQLRKIGFNYRQIKRTKKVAFYAQLNNDFSPSGYEVFKIKIQREREIEGRIIPRKEKFPSNEDFGNSAWYFNTYKRALARYEKLVKDTTEFGLVKTIPITPTLNLAS